MSDDRVRYYRERRGRAFWAPGKFAEEVGLPKSLALGAAGADAKAEALKWNERLAEARKAKKEDRAPPSRYPANSFGEFYERFRRTEGWAQMEPRTREDYERAWPHIEKRFAHVPITKINASDSEAFHVEIHPAHTNRRDPQGRRKLRWNTAYRVLKVWRSLLTGLVHYDFRVTAPIGKVTNPAPPGRSDVWLHDEVQGLVAAAEALKLDGMALAVRIAWDTLLAPTDAMRLPASGFLSEASEIRTQRQKTKRAVYSALTPATAAAARAYLQRLASAGITLKPGDALIRTVRLAPYAKKQFEKDFRRVRETAFPGDRRQFLDLRRSAITEARMGGANLDDLGANAANALKNDPTLQATYIVGASRNVLEARLAGRKAMAEKFGG